MANITGTTSDDVLTGSAGDDSIFGDLGNDVLIGLTGNNTLDGGGGADIMVAGTGNDTYYVDDASDVITDTGGIDTVITTISYVLTSNIEHVVLDPGAGAISVTANALANVITGNNADNSIGGLAGNDTIYGNDGNDSLDGGAGTDTLVGGLGNDVYVVDSSKDQIVENAAEGTDTVFSSTTYVLPANVENIELTGSASIGATGNALDNTILGNIGKNVLKGMDGNDYIDGGAGVDVMYGGNGNDTYYVDNSADKCIEVSLVDTDIVNSSANYVLGANIEQLFLIGGADINGTGNALDNTITGNAGNNTLDGGAGADTLIGGLGNDTYVIDDVNDLITDTGGNDTIRTSAFSIDLSNPNYANVENITLLGSLAINATANDANDHILSGSGNTAANILTGGTGNDTYFIDVHDTIVDGGGNDTMEVAFSFNLATSMAAVGSTSIAVNESGIENITLLGRAAINAIGDGNDNILTGNAGANTLDGAGGNDTLYGNAGNDHLLGGTGNDILDGGVGLDTMTGGTGDDTFFVDNVKDVVLDAALGGTDTVESTVSYNLAITAPSTFGVQELENLTLLGTANINGIGNAFDNSITGNTGNNTLDGGTGADILNGGFGNDVFIVDNPLDTVVEAVGQGTDTVMSSVSFDFSAGAGAGQELENLVLTGTGNIDGTGNALDNTITGNTGINVLAGLGGNDTYILGTDMTDTVTDSAGNDTIVIGYSFDLNTSTATLNGSSTVMNVSGIENITLTGTANLNATGDANDNILTGNIGTNTFDGGNGNDTYVVTSHDVILPDSLGNDTVEANFSYSIAARPDLENIVLLGTGSFSATGNDSDNILTGNSGSNSLTGGLGNDTLTGNAGNDVLDGGAGDDMMTGGLGNDTYIVDSLNDVIVESTTGNEGIDTIKSSIDYTIDTVTHPTYTYIENLTLTGSAVIGNGNDNNNIITGDAMNNTLDGGLGNDTLFGNAGDDIIIGGGDNDSMFGGAGNDLYFVDSTGDVVSDTSGVDVISSSVSYTLPTHVQYLTLTGTDDISGTGNEVNNIITGNVGNNVLHGLAGNDILVGGQGDDVLDGGTGSDSMLGGLGNDTYFVDTASDFFAENPGEGIDTLETVFSVTHMPSNFENITLLDTPPAGGSTILAVIAIGDNNANTLTGNSLDNTLTANGGDDTVIGGGGIDTIDAGDGNDVIAGDAGADIIHGGRGADLFVLSLDGGVDDIKDFNTAQGDTLYVGDILNSTYYKPGVSVNTDFVQLLQTPDNNVHVLVDPDGPTQADGSAATPFTEVALLENVSGSSALIIYDPLSLGI